MESGDNNYPCSYPWRFRKCPLSCGSVSPLTPRRHTCTAWTQGLSCFSSCICICVLMP